MSADARVKSLIDRVLRLKEEQDALADDIREVYAEAKAQGYNKTAMGDVVAYLRKVEKKGRDAVAEKQADFDLYLDAYERASGTPLATHTHEAASAKLVETVVKGVQTDIGRKALVAALDVMIAAEAGEVIEDQPDTGTGTHERPSINDKAYPEAGPQAEASLAGTGSGTLADREGRHEGEAASACLPANPEMDRATEGSFETGSEVAEKGRKAIPAGPEGADLSHAGADESSATNLPSTGEPLDAGCTVPSESTADEISESVQTSSPEPSKAGALSSSLSVPAILSDEDVVPAFMKDKPGCLKLRDGHCKIGFATEALCSECAHKQARAEA